MSCVNLELLAKQEYTQPAFSLPTDFSLVSIISHRDFSTIFNGIYQGEACIIESCNRIPYRIVCKTISLLNELNDIPNIVKLIAVTKSDSLGVVSLGYYPFNTKCMMQDIDIEKGTHISLLLDLLKILKQLHKKEVFHGWICKESVMIKEKIDGVILTGFYSAGKVGDKRPFYLKYKGMPENQCHEDPRKDDVYGAAIWFLSFYTKPENALDKIKSLPIEKKLKNVIRLMTSPNFEKRITASVAIKCIQKVCPSLFSK